MKRKLKAASITPVFFILGTLAALCGAGCSSEDQAPPASARRAAERLAAESSAWLRIEGFRALVYKGADLENAVTANSAAVDLEGKTAVLNDVKGVFYKDKAERANLSSAQGKLFLEDNPGQKAARNDLVLSGGVEIDAKNDFFLRAPEIHYSSREDRFVSSGGSFEQRLAVGESQWLITGGWFVADGNLEDFEYGENVTATAAPADRPEGGTAP